MKIIIYNDMHIGDSLFAKSFVKKLVEVNDNIPIEMIIYYNSSLFEDIEGLKFIKGSKSNEYIRTNFNGEIEPKKVIDFNNEEYLVHKEITDKYLKAYNSNYYDNKNDILYLKLWFGCAKMRSEDELHQTTYNNYYKKLIDFVNDIYGLNIKNIPDDYAELPEIPKIDTSIFNNKKYIFYYNTYGNSGQAYPNINHDVVIQMLGEIFSNYEIVTVLKTTVKLNNVKSLEDDYNQKKPVDCRNLLYAYNCALNAELVFSFDTGSCFYYCNKHFNRDFKGLWFHCGISNFYFNQIMKNLITDKVKFVWITDNQSFANLLKQLIAL